MAAKKKTSAFIVRTDAVHAKSGPAFYGQTVKLTQQEAKPLLAERKVEEERLLAERKVEEEEAKPLLAEGKVEKK